MWAWDPYLVRHLYGKSANSYLNLRNLMDDALIKVVCSNLEPPTLL